MLDDETDDEISVFRSLKHGFLSLLVSLEVLDWCMNIRKYIVPISNVNVYISDGNKCKQDIRPLMLPIASHGEPNLRYTERKCRKTCIIPSVWYRWGERGTVKSLSRTPPCKTTDNGRRTMRAFMDAEEGRNVDLNIFLSSWHLNHHIAHTSSGISS